MLHGPWVAAMLNEHIGGGSPGGGGPVTLDLSTFVNLYNSTVWNGTYLTGQTGNSYADFTFAHASAALDFTKTYTVEVDYTVTQGTIGLVRIFSTFGPTETDANNATWYTLAEAINLSGTGTLTLTLGPGLMDWAQAQADVEDHMLFEIRNYVQVTRIEISDGTPPTEPTPPKVVKAMAMKSTHVPSADTAFRSSIAANEITGTGYTAGGVEVANVVATWDAATSRAYVTCDLIDFGAVTANDIAAIVFYLDNGSAGADRVLWTDAFPPVNATGALTYQPSDEGAMEIRV